MPSKSAVSDREVRQAAKRIRAFADGTRLVILDQLARAEGELAARDFAQQMVRKINEMHWHMGQLCKVGLVLCRKEGKRRVYRLAGPWVAELLQRAQQCVAGTAGR